VPLARPAAPCPPRRRRAPAWRGAAGQRLAARWPAGLLLIATLLLPLAAPADAAPPAQPPPGRGLLSAVLIEGQRVAVRWTDGDTFHVDSGALRGRSVRLADVNTLEAYGPVHRIGTLSPAALLELARASTALAAGTQWECQWLGRHDVYGRSLARCPEAAAALVRAGHAMVFAVDDPADPGLLALQREAQAAGRGLWAGGVPPRLVSSLHSLDERGADRRGAYDRLVDTATGAAKPARHRNNYRACQEVCLEGSPLPSCLTYVPFLRRYRNRPPCLAEVASPAPGPATPASAASAGGAK